MHTKFIEGHDEETRAVIADWLELQGRPAEGEALRSLRWQPASLGADGFGLWAAVACGGQRLKLRWLPPGRLVAEARDDADQQRRAPVEVASFWLAATPCRQLQWRALMGVNPSHDPHPDRPVEQISWLDARAFGDALSAETPGLHFDLPSEAQWEYACRAGGGTTLDRAQLDATAWWGGNSQRRTQCVGSKAANAWGLYDMLGNVGEWCLDLMPRVEGQRPARAVRGGSWLSAANRVRPDARAGQPPRVLSSGTGFRIAAVAR